MAERTIQVTGYVLCQFLLVLLTPLAMLLSLINALLKTAQQQLEQAVEKPVHIHYELHQHVHLDRAAPSVYEQTLDQVSRHLPLPLQPALPVLVKSEAPRERVISSFAQAPSARQTVHALGAYQECRR